MAKMMDGQFEDADNLDDKPSFKVTILPPATSCNTSIKKVSLPQARELVPRSRTEDGVENEEDERAEEDDEDYDDDYDDEYDDDYSKVTGERGNVEMGGGLGSALEKNLISGKMNISQRMTNEISNADSVAGKRGANYTGRDDRATSEQVMDPRTRLMLFKLLNSGFLSEIDGCLSTGKEANVYYSKAGSKQSHIGTFSEYAIKVFKTSILVFKDRDK